MTWQINMMIDWVNRVTPNPILIIATRNRMYLLNSHDTNSNDNNHDQLQQLRPSVYS